MDPLDIALRIKNEGSADPATAGLQKAAAAATFTASAVQATSNLAVGVQWLLTKPDFAGATLTVNP